jgi:HpcH/HpaI aldolase/citrate lyase family protein
MVEKAIASDADAIILDLEDAVAPEAKTEARRNVVRGLKEFDRRGKVALCRVNTLDTPYFYSYPIEVVEGSGENLDAVLTPKVELPEDLYAVAALLNQLELATGLERRIEAQIGSAGGPRQRRRHGPRERPPLRRTLRPRRLVATRYSEFHANTIESFYGDPIPVLEDKFGSWRQPESWT